MALANLTVRRPARFVTWLAGGVASLLIVASVAAALVWMAMVIVPRFTSAPLSLPLQHTLWDAYSKPQGATTAGAPAELGVLFRPIVDGTIIGLRFYKIAGDSGPHVGRLWSAKGKQLATATFAAETDAGWQEALFPTPLAVKANRLLVASYFSANGGPSDSTGDGGAPRNSGSPLFQMPPADDRPLWVSHQGAAGFPSTDAGERAIWVDVVFVPTMADR